MLNERITLSTVELLSTVADALIVEDSGWLTASRGLAATVDSLYPELRHQREQALERRGAMYPLGAALGFELNANDRLYRHAIWAVTFGYSTQITTGHNDLIRATPLDIAAAASNALLQAAACGARTVVLSALGTRIGYHNLPPTPKKLPRYVMGAAQLVGMHNALQQTESIEQVTLCLTQRDYAIFNDLLGRSLDQRNVEDDEHD